ncbi:MAG: ABC transporter permease [Acidimicrobiales bacterium]
MTATVMAVPHKESSTRVVTRLSGLELRLLLREPMMIIGLLGFPLVTMLVIAGVFGQVPDPDFGGVAPDDHYIAGYIGVVVGALGIVTLPVMAATARELGVTRRFRAAGVSAEVLVATRVVVGIVIGIAASAMVLLAGASAYGMTAPEDPVGVVVAFATGLVCFIAIGLAIGSIAPTGRSASALGNLLFIPMFLLGGGGPPRDVMSGPMATLSDVIPLTHIVGALRLAWLGQTDDPHVLWYPLAVAASSVAVAVWINRRRVD